jgi:HK97 gp10 family phage protein
MAVKGFFSVDGLEAYFEKLAKAGRDVDPAADKAVEAGGHVVFDDMLDRVPVASGDLKAHLEKTGKTAIQREGNFHFMEIGLLDLGTVKANYGKRGKRSPKKQYSQQFLYGIIQEFGKSNMAAQPYVRPAFDNNRARVKQAEIESLKASGML